MKRNLFCLVGLLCLGCLACAPAPVVAPPGPPDHQHLIEHTVVVGDNHVSYLVNHRAGEARLLITDRYETPRPILAYSLPGTFRFPDGSTREATFKTTSWACRRARGACRASEYALRADWLRSAHRYELETIVPIEGVRYRVTFDYATSEAEDVHHRHEPLGAGRE